MPGRLMAEHNVLLTKAPAPGIGKQIVGNVSSTITATDTRIGTNTRATHQTQSTESQLSNGALTPGAPGPTSIPRSSPLDDLPPEIRHITEGYHPLSKLFGRASQECFNGLNELVSQLAQQPDVAQANGLRATPDQSTPGDARKRLQWLEFANGQREKFIKLLVILQWSKKVDDITKLVDIGVWNAEQRAYYDDSKGYMGNVRRDMAAVRRSAPDIDDALAVLTEEGLMKFSGVSLTGQKLHDSLLTAVARFHTTNAAVCPQVAQRAQES